jgi:hypothetical protein
MPYLRLVSEPCVTQNDVGLCQRECDAHKTAIDGSPHLSGLQ